MAAPPPYSENPQYAPQGPYPPPQDNYQPAQGSYPPQQPYHVGGYPPQQDSYKPQQPPPQQPNIISNNTTTVVTTQPAMVAAVPMIFHEFPVSMQCPSCGAQIVTAVHYDVGTLAWVLCLIMCLFG